MSYLIDFESLQWSSPSPGIRHKVVRAGDRVLRLVEYSQDMVPHKCERAHYGRILSGRLRVEFASGTWVFGEGDGVAIPSGPEHAHCAIVLTPTVTALFFEEP
jgi:mannose-6-phosphate isomerase-like protein (cupin superfamily)